MVVDTLADSISKGGGLGLADVVARSMMASHAAPKPAPGAPGASGAASTAAPSLVPTLKAPK